MAMHYEFNMGKIILSKKGATKHVAICCSIFFDEFLYNLLSFFLKNNKNVLKLKNINVFSQSRHNDNLNLIKL
ncbi:hypothetical protein BpHYR1_029763 [Brachionus plicatilis]|uniref:Uncharacterized protein n=1 Tax=Brachionus plicatilis TaxID=10195 RepID=A0A3M7RKY0_BRAPC|nr:hypothetical protein BpHYR1_029763 [Brachionus plicatilis]